jgi:hypothetical protein
MKSTERLSSRAQSRDTCSNFDMIRALVFRGIVAAIMGSLCAPMITWSNAQQIDPVSRIANISTRSWVGTGNDVQIAGFVISAYDRKTVLIRASGPALIPLGVTGVLPDPTIELHDTYDLNKVIATNDDWSADPALTPSIEAAASRTGAFSWTRGSKDAAILISLKSGVYTVIVRDSGVKTGAALIEVYDADESVTSGTLVNISTRAQARTGDDTMIAGFVVTGNKAKHMLIRGGGPALVPYRVTGTLSDPMIELHDPRKGNAVIAENDDWSVDYRVAARIDSACAWVGASAFLRESKDAALLIDLDPGIYTVMLKGKAGGTGNALLEVYEVPDSWVYHP